MYQFTEGSLARIKRNILERRMTMKKFLVISLAVLLSASLVYAVPATNNSGPGDILGNGKIDSKPHKIFRLVRFVPGSGDPTNIPSLTTDSIVVWDTNSDDGVTITTSATSCDSRVAGIVVTAIPTQDVNCAGNTATADIGHRNWGWLQTYGKHQVAAFCANSVISEGGSFGVGLLAGSASGYPNVGQTSVPTNAGRAGFVMDAVTASQANVTVFITGLD